MFTWKWWRKGPRSTPSRAARRPARFRPRLEVMEERCLLSTSTLTSSIQGTETTWHSLDSVTYATLFSGSATGTLAGPLNITVDYTGNPGYGINLIAAGGQWQQGTPAQQGGPAPLSGSFTGGSISWNPYGTQATFHGTLRVQQGTAAAQSATFDGTISSSTHGFVLTGTLSITTGTVTPPPTPTPTTGSFTYSDTVTGQQTTWHQVGPSAFTTAFGGTASGKVPGSFSATVAYLGMPNLGTDTLTAGGAWQVTPTTPAGAAATLTGTIRSGTIVWNQYGTQATVQINLVVSGGAKKSTGTGTFTGTLIYSKGVFVLTGSVTFNLTQPL